MTDLGPFDDRAARVIALIEHAVRTELQVTNGMLALGLTDASVDSLMQGVTSGLLYGFNVEWSPDWLELGQVHQSMGGGRTVFRSMRCVPYGLSAVP